MKTSGGGGEKTTVISKESEEGEKNLMIDVETVEPSEQAKFFVVSLAFFFVVSLSVLLFSYNGGFPVCATRLVHAGI